MASSRNSASEPAVPPQVNRYDDFTVGRRFDHHWGRTIMADEAISFATQNLLHEPMRFNRVYAKHLGYNDIVVSPMLVYGIVLGLSVEDLSESGGPFLGSEGVRFLRPVYPGDTLFASSVVVSRRPSSSKSDYGIVEWETFGCNQHGELVLSFRRTNMVRR